MLYKKNYLLK